MLQKPPGQYKARGRLVPTDIGISKVSRGQGAASTVGKEEQGLLLLCTQSGTLRNICPSVPQDRQYDTPQGTVNPEKKFWASGMYWLADSLLPFFRIHRITERQSLSLLASSFSFGLFLVLPQIHLSTQRHAFLSSASWHFLRLHRDRCTGICSPALGLGSMFQLIFLGLPVTPLNLAGLHLATYPWKGCCGEGRPRFLGHFLPPPLLY